jgi:hypothetical protein
VRRAADPEAVPFLRSPLQVDGIRHELVARVRRDIEAGAYDTEEKWRLAEERLLQHAERAF